MTAFRALALGIMFLAISTLVQCWSTERLRSRVELLEQGQ